MSHDCTAGKSCSLLSLMNPNNMGFWHAGLSRFLRHNKKYFFFIILHVSQDGKVHNSLVPLDLVHSLTGAENVFVYVFVYTNMKD